MARRKRNRSRRKRKPIQMSPGKVFGEVMMERAHQMLDNPTRYESKIRRQMEAMGFIFQAVVAECRIADFYHPEARLVVEIDGPQHYTARGRAADKARDRELLAGGVRCVLRFHNHQIAESKQSVVFTVMEKLRLMLGGHSSVDEAGRKGFVASPPQPRVARLLKRRASAELDVRQLENLGAYDF